MWAPATGAAKIAGAPKRGETTDRFLFLKELMEAGKYSLDQIAEAHRHAEAGHKKGHALTGLK
jgi:hypothetical protein